MPNPTFERPIPVYFPLVELTRQDKRSLRQVGQLWKIFRNEKLVKLESLKGKVL